MNYRVGEMDPSNPDLNGLSVSESPHWQYFPEILTEESIRVWSISPDLREDFGETVVESWGSTEGDFSHTDLAREFEEACASLPGWRSTVSHSWTEGAVDYTLVSGLATLGGLEIESTSVLALQSSGLTVTAHQTVVTTFAENRDRHVEALQQIRSTSSTIARWWYV